MLKPEPRIHHALQFGADDSNRQVAEIDGGWDVSDGEDVYFCPRVMLADDPDSPADTRPFVRLDQIRRWPQPS